MNRSLTTCSLLSVVLALGCNGWDDASATNKDGESDEERRGRIATNIAGVDPTMGDAGRAAPVGGNGGNDGGGNGETTESVEPSEPTGQERAVYQPEPVATPGPPWLVLSNFRKQSQGIQTLGETYRVDYRWVSGRPEEGVSHQFVVETKSTNGLSEQQAAKPVTLQPGGGTATIGLKREFGVEPPTCFLAVEENGGYRPISGRLTLGDATETAATPGTNTTVVAGVGNEPKPFVPPPVVEPTPAVVPPVQPVEPVPIAAPNDLPEAPSGKKGTAAYAVQDFVLKVAKADYDGLADVVADDAEGELGQLRDGKLPTERANEIRQNLFKVQIADARPLSNGSRQFVLRSSTGRFARIEIRSRRRSFVVVGFELSDAPSTVPDF